MRNHKAFSRQLLYYSPRFLLTLFALIILLLLTPIGRANADIGPKPNMDFTFEFPGDEIPITGGKLLRCDDKNCSTYSEFHGSLVCTKNNCNSWISGAYMEDYGEYNKLIISFSDKVRESNVFSKHGFGAKYTVLVNEDGLVVEQRPSISYLDPYLVILFTTALILTLLTETVVASIYIWIVKIKWRSLVWVVVANILSLSLVWFVITQFFPNNVLNYIIVAELFAIVFEALFLYFTGRNIGVTIKHSTVLSIIMNVTSFLVGWSIWYKLTNL